LHIIVYSSIQKGSREANIVGASAISDSQPFKWPNEQRGTAVPRVAGLAEQAYQAIRDAIQEGELAAGQRVPELTLCAWLKVSRTPVREALRRLLSEGMVEHAPGGGLSVAQHDLRAVAELYDLRESLEGTAAALAARGADATEISILQAMLDSRENILFHEHIYRAAHNRFLLKSLQSLHDSVALLGRTTFAAPGRIAEAMGEHHAIVAAITRHDQTEAEALARRHVRRGYELRVASLAAATQAGAQNRMELRLRVP